LMKKTSPILPLQHPEKIERNLRADAYTFKKVYQRKLFRIFSDWFDEIILGLEKKL